MGTLFETHMATPKKKNPIGQKNYTGNPNGRPTDRLKGLTPSELKQALSKIKKVTPKAVEIMVAYMEKTDGATQAKAAKELLMVYMSLDSHAVKRAESLQRILALMDKIPDGDEENAGEAFEEEESPPEPSVDFSLSLETEN
jgi:hypothetical protein